MRISALPLLGAAALSMMLPLVRGVGAAEEAGRPMLGFSREGAARQRDLEARFDAQLRRENLREWMQRLSSKPHHVGSRAGKANAEFLAGLLRGWGYDTQIEEFQVLFPTPTRRVLEMTAPEKFTARLQEPRLAEDATSGITDEQLPTYNAYSIDGDVTAPVVYVNQGVPKDYEVLAERGIDVKGKIVLARYGGSWRGIKPKVAAEHGAIGCLIYSDPKDDGYFQGDVYPKGAFRNEHGAQRGSVADMPSYAGDPSTPGVGATKDAKRLPLADTPTLTKIPVMPISYADALPILRNLEGPVAPEEWRGALPVTYHLGPGAATVHLALKFDWKTVPAYDVIARLRGAERPDEWVIRGNHHDAWNLGADDPISGAVALLEEARAVGELAKGGQRPRRTLIYCLWDGEEPGLLGSTEWVETHADELREHAVAYVNSDNTGRGFLRMSGSHTLERLLNEVAREVPDPQKGVSVWERQRAYRIVRGPAEDRREARERADLRLGALGSGSDYTPFLQHLGIASLDVRFGGENEGGSYHSIYDSFDHYTRFGDPGFEYGVALAKVAGRVMLRLANADVLPLEMGRLADTLDKYGREVIKLADDMREQTAEKNRQIRESLLDLVADPKQPRVAPKAEEPVPYLNFAPLQNALARVRESAQAFEAARSAGGTLPADRAAELDAALIRTERVMLGQGLPRRPWYRHLVYAPGFYTGYAVKTLPGIREAIEERKWQEAREQVIATASMLEDLAGQIDRATALIGAAPPKPLVSPQSDAAFPPHRIAGNLYYVGSRDLASYLITTDQGHVLINSCFAETVPLIQASVEKLGFKFGDVKYLLTSHAHDDHVAGNARVRALTGAKVLVMEGDEEIVRSGGKGDFQYRSSWEPCPVDRVLHDGDTVKLGGTTLTARKTAGHTRGCTTWTLDVPEGGKTLHAVIIGSPNVNPGYRLVDNAQYPGIAEDYARTFERLKALPCDLFLGAHGSYYDLVRKYPRLQAGGPNPFVDPEGYRAYVEEREQAFRRELQRQQSQ